MELPEILSYTRLCMTISLSSKANCASIANEANSNFAFRAKRYANDHERTLLEVLVFEFCVWPFSYRKQRLEHPVDQDNIAMLLYHI